MRRKRVLPEPDEIPASVGYFLAGFTDGEGCFLLPVQKPRPSHRTYQTYVFPKFEIKLRDDDYRLLDGLRNDLGGIGGLYRGKAWGNDRIQGRPTICWSVFAMPEIMFLIRVFDRFPLRGKKARDYAIWREATFAKLAGASTDRLMEYRQRLHGTREYQAQERDEEPSPQLRLIS